MSLRISGTLVPPPEKCWILGLGNVVYKYPIQRFLLNNQWTTQISIGLTGGVGANVDDLALGSVDLVLVRGWELRFHHDGVLRPGLQWQDEMTRLKLLFVPLRGSTWRVHVSDHPAVGAAGVLPVKLGYVLKRSIVGKNNNSIRKKQLLYVGLNCIPVQKRY